MFPLILRFCFSLELGLVFLFWVFNGILVFVCLSYLKVPPLLPSPRRELTFSGQNESRVLLMVELRYCLNMVTRQE